MSFPYRLRAAAADRATLGLIVLQADETLELDMRRYFPHPDITLLSSRIPSGADLTQDAISQMARDLPATAALFPHGMAFDAVGYGCTSGTTLLGADRVAELIRESCTVRAVCDPLSAAVMACDALGVTRIGLVSPYTEDIARPVANALAAAGINVSRSVSFGEACEANVVRIDAASIMGAARHVATEAEAVFVSCTNLRCFDLLDPLEAEMDVPVFGSNLALAWSMAQSVGVRLAGPATQLAQVTRARA